MRCPLCSHTEFGKVCCGNVKCLNCGAELDPEETEEEKNGTDESKQT